jgi:hypothetical protein
MADSSPYTEKMIFGTESDSDHELSDESNVQDHISAGSAVGSGKKRAAPEKSLRARLNLSQKMEAMKYFGENPGMTYPKLIEWCYKKFDMKKKLSTSAVSLWFSDKAGKRSQKEKLKVAMESETIPCKLAAKSLQGTHFPELEDELFGWVRRCESRKACLTDEIITEKALSMAASHGLANFKASEHWIRRFKKRHDIRVRVSSLQGKASSADFVNIHIAQAIIPKLLCSVSGHDSYNIDETGVNYLAQPTRTLASQTRSGIKLAKERLTAVLCCNATGSHKVPIMIIGNAKRPRCFPSGWEPRRDARVW